MSNLQTPETIQDLPNAFVKNLITLFTGGFGIVVGLAWTEVIKLVVSQYIDPLLGKNGSLISLLIYAIVMTFLAVIVTMQLTQLEKKLAKITGLLTKRQTKADAPMPNSKKFT
ncbi:MAG TPA: hypothetical protein DEP87_00650 [Candidatus Pacebacteria bacterium]|nr:hypothetical protein [Candidatus Paceibacterota bacterium]